MGFPHRHPDGAAEGAGAAKRNARPTQSTLPDAADRRRAEHAMPNGRQQTGGCTDTGKQRNAREPGMQELSNASARHTQFTADARAVKPRLLGRL